LLLHFAPRFKQRLSPLKSNVAKILNEITYRFLASEHDSIGILTKKSKMAKILGSKINFFNRRNLKIHMFQKFLPRFVVLSTRLDRICMGKFQTQKLIRPVILKDAETH
jgi:hypothetical protein